MAMLAAGHIDICLEYSLQLYDIATFISIIELAGGCVTRLDGSRAQAGGAIVASANSQLHEQVLKVLNTKL
jgi:fructose-1,6-bisphosphatase/inositol monophosphatase family enzyme